MPTRRTYLDYNASAPLMAQAREAVCAAMELSGNASSVHAEGRRLRGVIETAREQVGRLVNAEPARVVFTSGATEGNVTVLSQGYDVGLRPDSEHDSVLAPMAASGAKIVPLAISSEGVIDLGDLERALDAANGRRCVVAVQLANNETGVIQPLADVVAIARPRGARVHCDAVQAAGRVLVDFEALGVDTMVISAHKLGGPKGVGALIVRDGAAVLPLLMGGGQERRRRAGTENVAAIAGFGAAASVAAAELPGALCIAELRDRLEADLRSITPNAKVIGEGAPRLPNTTAVAVPDKAAEIVLIKLDLAGIAVSSGAACSSGKVGASHVLAAMGVPTALARGMIRVSLGRETTAADVDHLVSVWTEIHNSGARSDPMPRMPTKHEGRVALAAAGMGD